MSGYTEHAIAGPRTLARGLSDDQQAILEWLLDNQPLSTRAPWGIRWQPGKWGLINSRSASAAYSRTLKRLEERGLVLRQNRQSGNPLTRCARETSDEPHNRTTHVLLTEIGVQVAEWLTKPRTDFVNQNEATSRPSDHL